MRTPRRDPVWYQDVRVLWRRPFEFFPSRDQTPEERVNSLTRLVAYSSAAVYAYSRRPKVLLLGLIAVAIVSLAYKAYPGLPPRFLPALSDAHATGARTLLGSSGGDGDTFTTAKLARPAPPKDPRSAPSCRIKPNGQRVCTGKTDPQCTWSSPSNPFANVLLTEYNDNPDRPPACEYDAMKEDIRRNFNRGLIRSSYDVFERENSQRQYYSMPVTTTYPDTNAFAMFAYGTRESCKENPARCTGNEQ